MESSKPTPTDIALAELDKIYKKTIALFDRDLDYLYTIIDCVQQIGESPEQMLDRLEAFNEEIYAFCTTKRNQEREKLAQNQNTNTP